MNFWKKWPYWVRGAIILPLATVTFFILWGIALMWMKVGTTCPTDGSVCFSMPIVYLLPSYFLNPGITANQFAGFSFDTAYESGFLIPWLMISFVTSIAFYAAVGAFIGWFAYIIKTSAE